MKAFQEKRNGKVIGLKEIKAMKELRAGSEDALSYFIHKYIPYVTTVVFNIIGTSMDMADIEEVVADVFFAFWQNAENVHSVKGFLGTVARNKAKNKLREVGKDLPLNDQIAEDRLTLEKCAEKKELAAAVKKAVTRLPQPDREIFLRFYYYYQTQEEIAAEMGINISTVKTKLRRGRERLKQSLDRYLN